MFARRPYPCGRLRQLAHQPSSSLNRPRESRRVNITGDKRNQPRVLATYWGMNVTAGPEERAFRFGVYITGDSKEELTKKCRRAEAIGYDILGAPDHLGVMAPFPLLMLAASVTERPRLATAVLNAGFYNAALLARDVAATDAFSGGRLELGLGTGYIKADFDGAGLPWPTPSARVDHLEGLIAKVRQLLADPGHRPQPFQQPAPPLWVAGWGNRVLALAARKADIIGFTGFGKGAYGYNTDLFDADTIMERVEYTRTLLGERLGEVELNIFVWRVVHTKDRRSVAGRIGPSRGLTTEQALRVPTVLTGTARQIAEQLYEYRERFGFSNITVGDYDLDALAPVIELLR